MAFEDTEIINGKKISFMRCGDWTDEVILFFHGFTGSKCYISDDNKDTNICILSFDRPGVGKSEIQEYYSIEDFLESVNELLELNNIKSVHLAGHSAGGYYAQVFAEKYPFKVKSLSLLSSIIPLNCDNTKNILNGQWKLIKFLTLHAKGFSKFYFKKMSENLIKNYDKEFKENLNTISQKEKLFMTEHYELIKNAVMNAVANNGLGVYYDAYALCKKREEVKIKSTMPVFIWNGTNDDTTPVSFAQYLKKLYNPSEVHIIENMGHMLYLPYWEEIIKEISSTYKAKVK